MRLLYTCRAPAGWAAAGLNVCVQCARGGGLLQAVLQIVCFVIQPKKGACFSDTMNGTVSQDGAAWVCGKTDRHLLVTEGVAFVQRMWLQVGDARGG